MRRSLQAVVCGLALMAGEPVRAFSAIPAEDYLFSAARSSRVVLIDVESVKIESSRVAKGLEVREVSVVGTRIETIRGDDAGAEFRNKSRELRVSDPEVAERFYSEELVELLLNEKPHPGSSCKKGHRYLVIFDGDETIYFEVSKKDEEWRKKLLEFQKLWGEPPGNR